ncbi:hypothetical protein LTR04_004537 [Oleoguttula sp. CCFEE 6159]|nr:hypothetical protein LTR04_004537 [Oleoguttula sp. CCFEE 6159]
MSSLGASKVSLSSITSEELWRRSGRLDGDSSELFHLRDRKDARYLLSPTHEEEITALVGGAVKSYKDLPLRLYQISRKYRDERRPRQGLLRTREFLMKDLYTFGYKHDLALQTYDNVRKSYDAFFEELRLPYLVAEADSGSMGGNLSHEYHFVTPKGEDNVISCTKCSYIANEELAEKRVDAAQTSEVKPKDAASVWWGISRDHRTLVMVSHLQKFASVQPRAATPERQDGINTHAIKRIVPSLDASIENPLQAWKDTMQEGRTEADRIYHIIDSSLVNNVNDKLGEELYRLHTESLRPLWSGLPMLEETAVGDVTRIQNGDLCPRCDTGILEVQKAVEVGHTFHLGTRYSKPLNAVVTDEGSQQTELVMGCHGIGISRLIGAVASVLSDGKGLNWPAAIAPFQVVIIPAKGNEGDAVTVFDEFKESVQRPDSTHSEGLMISLDPVLDDRRKELGWKLGDADLVGYPVIVVLGRTWKKERKAEVQCRRLGTRELVEEEALVETVTKLLGQL